MKLHLTLFAMAAAIASMLASCTKTDVEVPQGGGDDDNVAAVIHAGIGGATRAHDAEWDENDAIGLAMLSDDGSEIINDVFNYHYVTSDRLGVFEPHSSAMMVYFPADGNEVTFRAYYPYYSAMTAEMLIPVDVANQNVLPDIDLMSADHVSGFTKRDPIVRLHFYHRLTKLIFKLSTGTGTSDIPSLENCTVSIRGMKTTGTYHLLEEDLEINNSSGQVITFTEHDSGPAERYGIVLPRGAGEGVEFDFTFPDGSSYTAKMDENLELLAGYEYTFHINLKETAATVSADIEPWVEAPARYYDSVQASVEAGPSINVDPGTVMDVFISENNQDYRELASFEYKTDDKWYPQTDVYWESIPYTPAYMRSSIVMDDPLNDTQAGDWLVSQIATVERNKGAEFKLTRAVSKVFVTLVSDQFTEEELNSATITLPDYLTGGYLEDGRFVEGSDRADILLVPDADGPTRAATSGTSVAIFQPQSVSNEGILVSISLNGRTYDVKLTDGSFTYTAGIAEQLVVRLNKEGVTVSATVVDWELGPVTSFDAVQVATVAGESHNVEPNDKLDLYMLSSGAYDYMATYTYNADGRWYGAPVIYWEDIAADPATFIARMDEADALNETQLPDVLLSQPTDANTNTGIDFDLTHAASKVIVALVSDTFSDAALAAATIKLPGYTIGGEFDGAVLVGGSSTGDIDVVRTDGISGVAIFEPQTVAANDPVVTITLNGKTYTAVAEDGAIVYEPGVATTLIVKFEKEEVSLSVSVTDWIENTIRLETVRVTATAGDTTGVEDGEEMTVYTGADREPLTTYTYAGANTWTTDDDIYWEDLDDPTTFYAAILRQSKYNQTMPDDYLLSGPTRVSAGDAVNFTLRHAVAQVAVQLTSDDGTFSTAELEAMNVFLPNYMAGGTYDNGVFTPGTTPQDVAIEKGVGEDGESGLAFVQAQTINAGTTVARIESSTRAFTVVNDSAIEYRAGYTTKLIIDMRKTEVVISAQVIDWQEGETVTMVPDPIEISGELAENDGFFNAKTIYVYNLTNNATDLEYTLRDGKWTGPALYWNDYPGGLEMTAVFYPYNDYIPVLAAGATTFPWNLPNDQATGWDRRDLLMSHVGPVVNTYFNFSFRHVVSQVVVRLTSSQFTDAELSGATVTLNNFKLEGTANLNAGTVVPGSAIAPTLTPYTVTAGKEFSALVMPQDIAPTTTVVSVTLAEYPGKVFTGSLRSQLSFTAGYITYIDLDLQQTEILLSATVEAWKDNGSGSVIIN